MKISFLVRVTTVIFVCLVIVVAIMLGVNLIGTQHSELTLLGMTVLFLVVFLTLIGTILMLVLRKKLLPLDQLATAIQGLESGNLSINFDKGAIAAGEIGRLTIGVYELVQTTNNLASDIETMYKKFNLDGDIEYRLNPNRYSHFKTVKTATENINGIVDDINASQMVLIDSMINIGEGNFPVEVPTFLGKKARISKTINDIATTMENLHGTFNEFSQKISSGDFDTKIDISRVSGSWYEIANRLNTSLSNINEPFDVFLVIMKAMQEGDFRHRSEGIYGGTLKEINNSINETMEIVASYVDEIDRVLSDISEGNLEGRIERPYVGIFDLIKGSVNSILSRLNDTMSEIESVAKNVSAGALMLSQSSMSLSQGVTRQMASVEEIASNIMIIGKQSAENSNNAKTATNLSEISHKSARVGNDEMASLLESMQNISESSSQISLIIKTIEDIAFQTNLLALNASVEASRAGEHGMGFAVVADAVRSLANKSSEAAQETNKLIKASVTSVNEGMKRATDTATSLDKILQNVMDVSSVVEEIFKSSEEQSIAISQVESALCQISSLIQKDAASSEETAAAAEELDAQVISLQQKLSYFKTRSSTNSILSKSWIDSSLENTEIDELKGLAGSQIYFKAREIIMYEGDKSNGCMYIIVDGHVEVYKAHGQANEILLATLKPGDIFGEMSLFLNVDRTATIVAREKIELLEVCSKNMNEFITKNPRIAFDLITTLCVRMKNMLSGLDKM